MKKTSLFSSRPFVAVLAFWFVVAMGMITYYQYPLWTGQEITVAVQPVDPRDFFRGDYVTLTYDFSRTDSDMLGQDEKWEGDGHKVYTLLEEKDGVYGLKSYSLESSKEPGTVQLVGTIRSGWEQRWRVSYGVESYFVPEGKGRIIEQFMATERVKAVLAVSSGGRAVIKHLLLDDEELTTERLIQLAGDPDLDHQEAVDAIPLTQSGQVMRPEPSELIRFSYPEGWVFDAKREEIVHNKHFARVRFQIREGVDMPGVFDCEQEEKNTQLEVTFCGVRQLSWQDFHTLEYFVDEAGRRKKVLLLRKSVSLEREDAVKKDRSYIITAEMAPEDETIWTEMESILSSIWVRNY